MQCVRHGFTLIELLVVISIITLLMALLLPALQSTRTIVHATSSMSNIRQVTIALHSYAGDNNSSMPFTIMKKLLGNGELASDSRFGPYWSMALFEQNYLPTKDIYWSPARQTYSHINPSYPHSSRNSNNQYAHEFESVGYAINRAVAGGTEYDFLVNGGDGPLRLNGSTPPLTETLLLVEAASVSSSEGSLAGYYVAEAGKFDSNPDELRLYNYNSRIVRSYVDGSALASTPLTSGLVSGNKNWVTNSWAIACERAELGWDPTRAYSGTQYAPEYGGAWTYSGRDDGRYHKPWFHHWRSQWYLTPQ